MFDIALLTGKAIIYDNAEKARQKRLRKLEEARISARVQTFAAAYSAISYKEGISSSNLEVPQGKCHCCGSLDFVKHNNATICSYCRTPNHVR